MGETKCITINKLLSYYLDHAASTLNVIIDVKNHNAWDDKKKSQAIKKTLLIWGGVEAVFYELITYCDKDNSEVVFSYIHKEFKQSVINMIPNIEDMLEDKNIFFDPEKLKREDAD
ncbi:MAG: hypothetical protein IJM40_00930 [Synergistaceae bacterium]|nr:hypothetical protein [Synergistaceae bacterium]